MSNPTDALPEAAPMGDDCSLPVSVQNRNIFLYALYWSIYYLTAPVSYVGMTHAHLLKAFDNDDTICNLPAAMYMWLNVVPVILTTWIFPQGKYVKPLSLCCVGAIAASTAAVPIALWSGASPFVSTCVVVAHGAVFGASSGVLFASIWDLLRRGVSTSRRGKALGFAFGVGPLFACVGALFQDASFDGKLLGGHSFGLTFPFNYIAMFATAAPLLAMEGLIIALYTVPATSASEGVASPARESPLAEVKSGLSQFVGNRAVLFGVIIYVIVYSGGNAILQNVSLYARDVVGSETDTLGIQSFLRFGFKAIAGAMLGWLLATASPRATLLATTSILLLGMGWALTSSGWPFLLTFGLLGAGELFGCYYPNYVTTASLKRFVRLNISYLSVLSAFVGFSSILFGAVADRYGRIASFYVAAGLLLLGLALTFLLLPRDPTPREGTDPTSVG